MPDRPTDLGERVAVLAEYRPSLPPKKGMLVEVAPPSHGVQFVWGIERDLRRLAEAKADDGVVESYGGDLILSLTDIAHIALTRGFDMHLQPNADGGIDLKKSVYRLDTEKGLSSLTKIYHSRGRAGMPILVCTLADEIAFNSPQLAFLYDICEIDSGWQLTMEIGTCPTIHDEDDPTFEYITWRSAPREVTCVIDPRQDNPLEKTPFTHKEAWVFLPNTPSPDGGYPANCEWRFAA